MVTVTLTERGSSPRLPRFYFQMYSAVDSSLIYHLILSEHRTLCGLWIIGELHLIHEKPKDAIPCHHCKSKVEKNIREHYVP